MLTETHKGCPREYSREYSFLPYFQLEALVKDIYLQQNEVAAARSPCGGFKIIGLHFKVKNTPLKDKKWKEKVRKNAQFYHCLLFSIKYNRLVSCLVAWCVAALKGEGEGGIWTRET